MKRLFSFPVQLVLAAAILAGMIVWQTGFDLSASYFKKADSFAYTGAETAVRYYLRGLEYGEGSADVYYKLGLNSFIAGDYARTQWAMQQALARDYARPSEAYVYLGTAQRFAGDAAAALETYQTALAAPPDSPTNATLALLYSGRGWSLYATEGCPAALPDFQRALELDPNLTEAQQGLAQCQTPTT